MKLKILVSIYIVSYLVGLGLYLHNNGFDSGYETGVIAGYFKMDKPKGLK